MPAMRGLLKVSSMAGALGVYLPAMAAQRGLALLRVLLLIALLHPPSELGLWGLASLLFTLAGPMLTLGSHLGLTRFVSRYEARGQLRMFAGRCLAVLPALAGGMTVLALLASPLLARWVLGQPGHNGLMLVQAALANALLIALYHNLQAFLTGMRVYRLFSAVELGYTILFTIAATLAAARYGTALAVLLAHAGSLVATLAVGLGLLRWAVRSADIGAPVAPEPAPEAALLQTQAEGPEPVAAAGARAEAIPTPDLPMRRVLHFGLLALAGHLLWLATGYVSFWMTGRQLGPAVAGSYYAMFQLAQLILYVANAAWAVVFSHVARRWEGGEIRSAMASLQLAFKALTLGLTTLSVIVYLAAPWWSLVLPQRYRQALPLLGGLLMMFQSMSNLSLATMLANLRRQPIVLGGLAAAGGAATAGLAAWWLPLWGAWGAAWAAGAGMYLGGVAAASLGYLAWTRSRLQAGTLAVLLSPGLMAMFLLPQRWVAAAVWAAVLVPALATGAVFSRQEKAALWRLLPRRRRQA